MKQDGLLIWEGGCDFGDTVAVLPNAKVQSCIICLQLTPILFHDVCLFPHNGFKSPVQNSPHAIRQVESPANGKLWHQTFLRRVVHTAATHLCDILKTVPLHRRRLVWTELHILVQPLALTQFPLLSLLDRSCSPAFCLSSLSVAALCRKVFAVVFCRVCGEGKCRKVSPCSRFSSSRCSPEKLPTIICYSLINFSAEMSHDKRIAKHLGILLLCESSLLRIYIALIIGAFFPPAYLFNSVE